MIVFVPPVRIARNTCVPLVQADVNLLNVKDSHSSRVCFAFCRELRFKFAGKIYSIIENALFAVARFRTVTGCKEILDNHFRYQFPIWRELTLSQNACNSRSQALRGSGFRCAIIPGA